MVCCLCILNYSSPPIKSESVWKLPFLIVDDSVVFLVFLCGVHAGIHVFKCVGAYGCQRLMCVFLGSSGFCLLRQGLPEASP